MKLKFVTTGNGVQIYKIQGDYYADNKGQLFTICKHGTADVWEQEGIRFAITVQCSGLEFIESVVVTVLFANLLDNAMEACRQCKIEKEIYVSIRSYNEMVSIRIENTVEKEVRFSPEGRPIRGNGEQGGIGILNVEKCVEKYGGSVLYRQKNGKLYSDILLNR